MDDEAQNNYRNQANNGLIYDSRNYNRFDENSVDEIDEEDRDEKYSVGNKSSSNDEDEDYQTYDSYENEQGYNNQEEHSKINVDVSKELEIFMNNVVRTPTNSPVSRGNDDKSPHRTRDLVVTIEDSTNEFLIDEAMSPSRIWHKVYDPNTGQYYYFNEKTKETQWHEPTSPSIEIRSMSPFEDEQ